MNRIVHERRLLNIWIVRASVAVCLLCFGIGVTIFLWHGGQAPASPSGSLLHILKLAVQAGAGWHASAFLNAGLVILLLTPMVRLVAGVYVSLRMRDWLYAVIGLIVIALVLIGLLAGQSGG
ncbi:MAG TPA: DUF1634 domain-containing protein [Gammaproteobacteria bacterium]|nr:DUF1634 domain-containing protein [Gammaproteobacteria bacterium]